MNIDAGPGRAGIALSARLSSNPAFDLAGCSTRRGHPGPTPSLQANRRCPMDGPYWPLHRQEL